MRGHFLLTFFIFFGILESEKIERNWLIIMTLISIDASTKSTGIAYFKNNKLVDYLCLNASETEMLDRINTMTKQVSAFCNKYKPDTIIM